MMAKNNDKKSSKLVKAPEPDNESKSEIVEIEQELRTVNPKIFEGLNQGKKVEILSAIHKVSVIEKHHSGPLPDADTMIQYNSVIPNGADRIMIMAEKQQDHRMGLENKAVTSQLSQSKFGQIFGFILSVIIISACTYLSFTDHETTASILGGTTIISLAGIFVLGRRGKTPSKKTAE